MVPVYDAKWRFLWKIGERPEDSPDNYPPTIPADFPDWTAKMDKWGEKLNGATFILAEMAAIGMGLARNTFSDRMIGGSHLLAPTGSDLKKNDVGAIFAGFHYDISFMTIHGKSRYPGLSLWTREWKKVNLNFQPGCLFVQAGASFEHITGGYVLGGFHEVTYTEGTKNAYLKRQQEWEEQGMGQRRQWRVSSTAFNHFRGDVLVDPLPELSHLYDSE